MEGARERQRDQAMPRSRPHLPDSAYNFRQTAAKASARAAAEHLLKRDWVHILAEVYTCAYDRRLKQSPHLRVMQSGIDR